MRKNTLEEFVKKARKVHGDKYDYSKVEYINQKSKVCIVCPEHGEFWQAANNHLTGSGCKLCARPVYDTKSFIKGAKKVHGDKYDYSKVTYIDNTTKVCIICPEHGEFWQEPYNHLQNHGCPKCKTAKIVALNTSNTDDFIKKAILVHGNKYDYSKTKYKKSDEKVCIICPQHGEFWQTPNNHLGGDGCSLCSKKRKKTTESFIEEAKKIHGDEYDYSKVKYTNNRTKVCIICPQHGEFWQTPDGHINQNQGCPICRESKLEKEIRMLLNENKIKHIQRKKFEWLKKDGYLHYDFFLPDYNVAIECQGLQHFKPIKYFGGAAKFEKQKEYDLFKKEKAIEHNIKLLYYAKEKYTNEIFKDKYEILKNL